MLINTKHLPKKRTIAISADLKHNNNELIVTVKDSGEGIYLYYV
jgi:sensor histidine kinase regulating citrate/malate metabolism